MDHGLLVDGIVDVFTGGAHQTIREFGTLFYRIRLLNVRINSFQILLMHLNCIFNDKTYFFKRNISVNRWL